MKKIAKRLMSVVVASLLLIGCVPAVPADAATAVKIIEIDPGTMEGKVGEEPRLFPVDHDTYCDIAYIGWVCEDDKSACMSREENNIINPYKEYTPFERFEAGKKYNMVLGVALDKTKGTFASNVEHIFHKDAQVKLFEDETNYYAELKLVSDMKPAVEKNTIKTSSVVTKYKSSKKQSFKLKVTCKSGAKDFTFKSSSKKVTVDKNGKVTIAKNYTGTAKITVKSPKADGLAAASKTIKIVVKKK